MRTPGLIIALLLASILLTNVSHANELKPFTTDGCSLWIDGTLEQPNLWRHCCVAHDLDYWKGGSEAQRRTSDENIQACVNAALGQKMANYMYDNVRWGGSPYWMNYYRWGYGWNYFDGRWPRGYKEATAEEQQLIDQAMPAALRVMTEDALANPARSAQSASSSNSSTVSSNGAQDVSAATD